VLLAQYFAETTLLDCSLMQENPSRVAACCIYAVQSIYKADKASRKGALWNSTLSKHTSYRESELSQMAQDLVVFVQRVEKSSFLSAMKKYQSPHFGEVALFFQTQFC